MNGPVDNRRAALEKLVALLEAQADEEDFSLRTTYTYLLGVYLAVNALRDAYLLVEGPDCTYMKAQYIQGNHDWLSTLTSVSGFHRIANTALHPAMMAESREDTLKAQMETMAAREAVGLLLLTSMPMAFITGADYERLCSDVTEKTAKQVVFIPGLSLSGDWIDGYAETLKALARQIDLSAQNPRLENVAVVGYLFDRNEEDHRANIRVLGEMCAAAKLNLVSVWLSGQSCAELSEIGKAKTIIALPYGERAARYVARRTGAEVISLPIPFGLSATETWLKTLGERFNAQQSVRAYADQMMSRIAPRLEWLIPFVFQNVKTGYVGDPHLLPGLRDIITLLGGELKFALVTNRPAHVKSNPDPDPGDDDGVNMLVWPKLKAFIRFIVGNVLDHDIGLLVTNNYGANFPLPETAVMEFGFPSIFAHALYERPFLGYPGFLAFVDTLANTLRQAELARARAALTPK